jgi:hypothetical protein
VVPHLDVEAMAEQTGRLLTDTQLRTAMGTRAKEKVLERHLIDVAAPKILRVIEELI